MFVYNGCKPDLHMWKYYGNLDEPIMYKHGLGNTRSESLNKNHIDDMINMVMFTIEATSSHVMIGRSEERRVGKECRIGCRSRWSPYH